VEYEPRGVSEKNEICTALSVLKDNIERFDAMSDPDNEPEEAETYWNSMMEWLEGASGLYDKILSYNELTENKHITEPGLQAAFGAARGIMGIAGMLQQVERINKFNTASAFVNTYDTRKAEIIGQLDLHTASCEAYNVFADGLVYPWVDADELVKEFEAMQKKYQKLIKKYDKEIESEEDKIQKERERTLKKAEAELLLLNTRIACLEDNKGFNELLRAQDELEVLKNKFSETIKEKSIYSSYDDAYEDALLMRIPEYKEAWEKERTLSRAKAELWRNFSELVRQLDENSYAREHFNQDVRSKSLKSSEKNLDAELVAAKEQYEKKIKQIAELKMSAPSYTDIHDVRKEVSKNLKNVNAILEAKKEEVSKNIADPVKTLHTNDTELRKQVKAFNDDTVQMKQDVSEMSGFDPVPGSRDKMRYFADMLGKNKRRTHSDGDEFKALKQLVENYANNEGDVTMEQIQAASKAYLDAKEKQLVSANSKMRNYRKTVVSLIGEYAGVTAKKVKDYNERMAEFSGHAAVINNFPNEGVNFVSYCTKNQDGNKLHNDFQAGLNAHRTEMELPLMNVEQQIQALNKMVEVEAERKLEESKKLKEEKLSNAPENKKPKNVPVFDIH